MSRVVIDVSSRENSPARRSARGSNSKSKSKPLPRHNRAILVGDVIELTDSESDSRPVAGPSRPQAKRMLRRKGKDMEKVEKSVGPAADPSNARQPALAPPVAAGIEPPPPPHHEQVEERLPLFIPDILEDNLLGDPPLHPLDLQHGLGTALAQMLAPPQPVPAPVPIMPPANPMPQPDEVGPAAAVTKDEDDIPFDAYVAQVLEIVPDVLPAHVLSLFEQHYPNYKEKVVEPVLHCLFENPDYPKADAKGKRKRQDNVQQQSRAVKAKMDYGSKDRAREGGPHYLALALESLESVFSDIPTAHIRLVFHDHNGLYAPTYLTLRAHRSQVPLPYKVMVRHRNKGKGKRVQRHDEELDREMQWIREKVDEEEAQKVAQAEEETRLEEEGGIECGCCFTEYPFDKMVQCPEAHLFCKSCMMSYAETKLGAHDANIVCVDQSGCKLPFPESELRRFLTPKLLELYERVIQRKEIEAAGLEGLEECPFCEYKCVIENDQERLFRCESEGCGAVTCRKCKKPDHLPKSCEEVEEDKKLDVRHAIEEAMTRALMRNCPKCQKAFVKEMGCNKMTCPQCATLSCYICRKVITGYDHFANKPDPKKCPLWDTSVEGRHSDEVAAAAKRALEEYKRAHPELDEKDIAVELPPAPAPAPGPSRGAIGAGAAFAPLFAPLPPHQAVQVGPRQRQHNQHLVPLLHPPAPMQANLHHGGQVRWDAEVAVNDMRAPAGQDRLADRLGPIFNLQVHINNVPPQPQAGPAFVQAPQVYPGAGVGIGVGVPGPAPAAPALLRQMPAAPPPRAQRPRRSARTRGRK